MTSLPPFRLSPTYSPRPWGAKSLEPWYEKKAEGEPIGEVWLTGDLSTADGGPCDGQTLEQITLEHTEALLGVEQAGATKFPLLMKVLFPKDMLSVQVHPDDALAKQLNDEPFGKTECWYALEAEPGAKVALGLKPGTTHDAVERAIHDQTLEGLLQWVEVEQGDMIFVDAGTVHAIGPGVILLETQQQSDLTYRMYDYGRGRELHVANSLLATRLETDAGKVEPRINGNRTQLIQSRYFRVDHYRIGADAPFLDMRVKTHEGDGAAGHGGGVVQMIFVASGEGAIEAEGCEAVTLKRGEIAVIPASAPKWELRSEGQMEILRAIPQ